LEACGEVSSEHIPCQYALVRTVKLVQATSTALIHSACTMELLNHVLSNGLF
jgi:hypothetical protein